MDNQTYPFVSVIIPVYNEKWCISRCLDSVLNQNYSKDLMEIVVVDNGSNDGTLAILRYYQLNDARIKVLSKLGGTIAAVRNFGERNSIGSILAFLDGDSVVEPNWLKIGINQLKIKADIVCVGFAMSPPSPESHWVQKAWYDIGNSSRHKNITEVKWLCSFNMIIDRKAFKTVNGFDEDLITGEDYDLGVRLNVLGKLIFSNASHVIHLGNVNSVSEMVLKEMWRSKGGVYRFIESKGRNRDAATIIIPLSYLIVFVYFVVAVFILNSKNNFALLSALLSAIFLGVVPLFMIIRKHIYSPCKIIRGIGFYIIYLLSRGVASLCPQRRRNID